MFTLKRFSAHPSDRREGEGERTVAPGSTTTRRLVKDQRLSFDYKYTNAALVEPSALNEGDDFDMFAGVRVSRIAMFQSIVYYWYALKADAGRLFG